MFHKPFRHSVWLLFLLLALTPLPLRAQTDTRFQTFIVRVWPEFDQPAALVFLSGRTVTSNPATLTFDLPATASLNAVAYFDGGELLIAEHTESDGAITITTPNGSFHIEFYDTALDLSSDARRYNYTVQLPHAADEVIWEVQQPVGASSLSLDPSAQETTIDQFGLTVLRATLPNVAADFELDLSFSYTKTDATLSVASLQGEPAAETGGTPTTLTPETTGVLSPVEIAAIIIVVVVMFGGGAYWYTRRQQRLALEAAEAKTRRPPRKAKRTNPKPKPKATPPPASAESRFCTQCGKPVAADDQFCRHCGAGLRENK